MSDNILEIRDLTVAFRTEQGPVEILQGVSFDVKAGEIVSVVGESGSGKSVTSLAIMRLITDPNAMISGTIRYKGRNLPGLSAREMRKLRGREIAMIFQDPMTALTPVHTIGWQIAEQLRIHFGVGAKAARTRSVELLGKMGIPDPERAYGCFPHQLSGGMRQRAMIAMAISCDPAILIADEPTTALDVTVQAQILDLLQDLRREYGSSIILITHDMGVVSTIADRVLVMYSGRIIENGAKSDLLDKPQHPYTLGLMRSIPPMTGERPHRLPSISGSPPLPGNRPEGCSFRPRCEFSFSKCNAAPPLFRCNEQFAACFLAENGSHQWQRNSAQERTGE
ncbi:ABC transporter ATP-binding protein [Phyllobacterium endophyticum]|uniref:ABC transporter ATP-binding protein n=1 Tax=Phyllobacterium endophyticum TaxID=1149773 RepID=A0A2P7AKJ9_9HYPH|nr:ABC transporter ATP-binding protein [Phyllobacterium endophyticum]MBB3237121.1 peptide/nickel transport system ATP-binding protein [Phyllobacterium endophyticum]PSH54722.1 ABC transporter ATP-binding protein [Phyllobacterium endophyticum]TYR40582.1 ABC transporter ATP-binding protein [Phyllobacterium endophyticum]